MSPTIPICWICFRKAPADKIRLNLVQIHKSKHVKHCKEKIIDIKTGTITS